MFTRQEEHATISETRKEAEGDVAIWKWAVATGYQILCGHSSAANCQTWVGVDNKYDK